MSTVQATEPGFFVTGGTLPPEASSYVERAADRDLYRHLREGRFCYVLNSRQMGKSSLCVRTMGKLEADGVRCAFVDLTKIGGRNVTPDQWYAGIALDIGRSLGVRREVLAYWKANEELSPVQRLFGSLREVALATVGMPIVVFFDEIDATRSLSFSADEFFAAIRESFNRRVQDPEFSRLTFCLLGVAVPSDLIANPDSTPFNIGERIYLGDFSFEEAMTLASGLGANGRQLLERVYYWTDGHPFLTQTLCSEVASRSLQRSKEVDQIVAELLLDPKARESNINLADVSSRALRSGDAESDPDRFRSDLLSSYRRALTGGKVRDDEGNRVIAMLKLSGLMRSDGRNLFVRNRIYGRVFDRHWVAENMPGQETRRLRTALWAGVFRTTLVGAAVILIVGWLAASNQRLANALKRERDAARYEAYVSDLNLMTTAYATGDRGYLRSLLERTAGNPSRGMEWSFWNNRLHDAQGEWYFQDGDYAADYAPDAKSVYVHIYGRTINDAFILDFPSLKVRQTIRNLPRGYYWCFPNGTLTGLRTLDSTHLQAYDAVKGRVTYTCTDGPGAYWDTWTYSADGSKMIIDRLQPGNGAPRGFSVWAVLTGERLGQFMMPASSDWRIASRLSSVSDDGRRAAIELLKGRVSSRTRAIAIVDLPKGKIIDEFPTPLPGRGFALNRDGTRLAYSMGGLQGRVVVRDVAHHQNLQSWNAVLPGELEMRGSGRFVVCMFAHAFSVYDVLTGGVVMRRAGVPARISPDETSLVAAGDALYAYDLEPDRHRVRYAGATQIASLSDGRLAVFSPDETRIADGQTLLTTGRVEPSNGEWPNLSSYGDFRLETGPQTQTVVDVAGEKPSFSFAYNFAELGAHEWDCHSPSGPVVTIDDSQDRVALFEKGSAKPKWEGSFDYLTTACISPLRSRVALGDSHGALILLDASTGKELARSQVSGNSVFPQEFSFDGESILAISKTRLLVWRPLQDANGPVWLEGSNGAVMAVFSPDASRVVGTVSDGSAVVWDSVTGRKVTSFSSPEGRLLSSVAISRDGNSLYALQDDGTLYHWSLADRETHRRQP